MASKSVPLGGQPPRATAPADQLSKPEAHAKARADLASACAFLQGLIDDFKRVPGDEFLDDALSALKFADRHIKESAKGLRE